jgi:hypothetical protein
MCSRRIQGLALALGGLVLAVGGRWAPGLWAGDGSTWVPIAQTQPIAEAGTGGNQAASLDRPVAGSPVDPQVRPTAYTISTNDSNTVSSASPRPLPVGPTASGNGSGSGTAPYSWAPAPSPVAPGAAATPGTVLPSTPFMPGADGTAVPVNPGGSVIVGPNGPVLATPGGPPVVGPGSPGGPLGPGIDGCCAPGICCDPSCCGGDCCSGDCCGCGDCCCDGCCFNNRFYAIGEYLLWFIRGSPTPPLVTTGSPSATFPGAIGQPGTDLLFGGRNYNNGLFSGFRGWVGYWLTDDHLLGVELGGFFLFPGSTNYGATSFGSPVLARPFINEGPFTSPAIGANDEELVSFPGMLAGRVAVNDTVRFWGAEANLRSNLCCGCNYFVDGLLGFRYMGLNDSLAIAENLTVTAPGPFNGATSQVFDRFATQNRFYGTQFGFAGEYRFGRGVVGGRSVIALGVNQQIVDIAGGTINTVPGLAPVSSPGGLLALSSNSGRHTRDKFGVIPEIGLNVGYQITPNLRAYVGYNFLFWNSVVRPGNQIDQRVNQNLIPPVTGGGPPLPGFVFHGSDFWAQGVVFGLEFRW